MKALQTKTFFSMIDTCTCTDRTKCLIMITNVHSFIHFSPVLRYRILNTNLMYTCAQCTCILYTCKSWTVATLVALQSWILLKNELMRVHSEQMQMHLHELNFMHSASNIFECPSKWKPCFIYMYNTCIDYDIKNFSSYRYIGKSWGTKIYMYHAEKKISGLKNASRLKNKNCDCESSQKFHGNKIRPVFQLSEVRNKSELLQWDDRSQRSRPTNLPMSMVHTWMTQFHVSLS